MKQIGRRLHQRLNLGSDINIRPAGQCVRRQVHLVFPARHGTRHGNASPQNSRLQALRQSGNQRG